MGDEVVVADLGVVFEAEHGVDGLPPAFVGETDDIAVDDVGVRLQRLLDLLGVDLLATGVDADRTTAEQGDRAVGFDRCVITGDRIAHTVDRREGLGGLLLVFEVAEGHDAPVGEAAPLSRTGFDNATVIGNHDGGVAEFERGGLGLVGVALGELASLPRALRGAECVEQGELLVLEESRLGFLRPHDT